MLLLPRRQLLAVAPDGPAGLLLMRRRLLRLLLPLRQGLRNDLASVAVGRAVCRAV
jgi:hypothetical protein